MLGGSKWRNRLARIEKVLGLERRLLRDGRIDELAALTHDRERISLWLTDLPDSGPPEYRRHLEHLRQKARQNGALLRAYIEGARSALSTVTVIEEEQANLGAYARDGTRIDTPKPSSTTRTRA
ncbi:MAG: hypothetical protein AAGH74_00305 [Pseudomonadota bacterium]